MPQSDAINDPIFVHILMGDRFGWLDFHLPRALAKWRPFAQRTLDLRPVLGAVAGALLGMAAIFGIDRYFAEPPFEPAQWQVTVQYQKNTQPLAIALQQDQFQVEQSSEIGGAMNKPEINTIFDPPGGDCSRRVVRGAAVCRTCGRLSVAGAAPMGPASSRVFASPGLFDL